MATTTNNILLPHLEDTGLDGKKIYTPKEWTERLRHYIKRIHDIEIKPALSGETMPTNNEWTEKEPTIRQDFVWGAEPSAIETTSKEEFNTDPDTINTEKLLQLVKDYYMPKRNSYHNRGDFFWAKQEENETPEDHWRKLVSLAKDCEFKDIKQEDLLTSKFITSITDKKLREKLIREKTLNLKTTVDLVTRDSYDKRHKQSTTPPSARKRERNKRGTNTKNVTTRQTKLPEKHRKDNKKQQLWILWTKKLAPTTQMPRKTVKCNNCHKIRHFARVCRRRRVNNLEPANSEEEESEPEEIQRITEINKILPDKHDNDGIKLKTTGNVETLLLTPDLRSLSCQTTRNYTIQKIYTH